MRCEFRYSLCLMIRRFGLSGYKMGERPKYAATTHGISAGPCMNTYALVEKL